MIEAQPRATALRVGRLIDGSGGAALLDQVVVMVDDRIDQVVGWAAATLPADLTVDHHPDATLVPGFIDAHMHLAFSEAVVRLDRDAAMGLARVHARELLMGGVTTARDLGVPHGVSVDIRDGVARGDLPGPRLLVAIQPVTRARGHCHWFGRHAEDATGLEGAVAALAAEGADVIKVMITGGMSTPGSTPGVAQYSVAEVRVAVDEAHRAGLRVAAHVLGTAGVRVAMAAGVDTLEHGWTVTGLDQQFERSVVAEVAASPMVASVTSHEKLRQLLPGEVSVDGDPVELRRRLAPHRALLDAGVPLVVHSDCGPYQTRYDRFGLSVRVFALGMGVDMTRAIHAATLAPARALGVDAMAGSVEAGKRADLVLLDGDPSTDPGALTRIRRVIQGGHTVVRDGALASG